MTFCSCAELGAFAFGLSRSVFGVVACLLALKVDGGFEFFGHGFAFAFLVLTVTSAYAAPRRGRVCRALLLLDACCLVSLCFSTFVVLLWWISAGGDASLLRRDDGDLWIRVERAMPFNGGYGVAAFAFAFALLGVAAKAIAFAGTHSEVDEAPFFVASFPSMALGLVVLVLVPLVHSACFALLLAASDWLERHPFEGSGVSESLFAAAAWIAAGTGIFVPFAWLSAACEKLEKRTIGVALGFLLGWADVLFWSTLAVFVVFAGASAKRLLDLGRGREDSPWLALMKDVGAGPVALLVTGTALFLLALVKACLAFVFRHVGGARFRRYRPVRRRDDFLDDATPPPSPPLWRRDDVDDDLDDNGSRTSVPTSSLSSETRGDCPRGPRPSSGDADSVPPSPRTRPVLDRLAARLPALMEEPPAAAVVDAGLRGGPDRLSMFSFGRDHSGGGERTKNKEK